MKRLAMIMIIVGCALVAPALFGKVSYMFAYVGFPIAFIGVLIFSLACSYQKEATNRKEFENIKSEVRGKLASINKRIDSIEADLEAVCRK